MLLEPFVRAARDAGASDLHLEGGLPAALRVRGELRLTGEAVAPVLLSELARELVGDDGWAALEASGSQDLARVVAGVRCRVNVLRTSRGVGLAVRLLAPFQATLRRLNLHPSLRRLVESRHGLVVVSGPTGSGKSSTVAALLQEVNLSEARHIVTIESPIEHVLTPRLSLVRQREVGRHTPSVAQALVDALREDPDVLLVGELRDPESMRLTLNAAETGHLVLTTLHSATCAEALQRLVGAFPAESQPGVCAQLADCLVAVVCQRLVYRPEQRLRVPECEVLVASSGVRGAIRQGQFYKLASAIEGGGGDGSFSFARYRDWLDARTDWAQPTERDAADAPEPVAPAPAPRAPAEAPRAPAKASAPKPKATPAPATPPREGVIVIDDAGAPEDILAQFERKKR